MKSNNKIQMLRPVLTEVLSIVIGVLLALAVNEWNEDRIQTARADEAIQNILHEIESNIKLMEIVNTNNKTVVELLKNENAEVPDGSGNQQFLPGLQIQDTAWKTLQSTGVSQVIEYSTLYTLSNVYSLQEIYKNLGYNLIQNFANHRILLSVKKDNESNFIDNKVFTTDMALIVSVESALLDHYKKIIKQLKSKPE
jgi:hypothetical protein